MLSCVAAFLSCPFSGDTSTTVGPLQADLAVVNLTAGVSWNCMSYQHKEQMILEVVATLFHQMSLQLE